MQGDWSKSARSVRARTCLNGSDKVVLMRRNTSLNWQWLFPAGILLVPDKKTVTVDVVIVT
jgi:hypothetical protein